MEVHSKEPVSLAQYALDTFRAALVRFEVMPSEDRALALLFRDGDASLLGPRAGDAGSLL